jgi:hypothetical protein
MKKSFGVYVVEVFAFLAMLFGLGIVVAETLAHYRPYFTHKDHVLSSDWTVTPFIVGASFFVFGSLILGYTIVKPALDEVEDASGFITNLLGSLKFWGKTTTNPVTGEQKTVVVAESTTTPAKPDPDKDK